MAEAVGGLSHAHARGPVDFEQDNDSGGGW
jgi:hypothetical protein